MPVWYCNVIRNIYLVLAPSSWYRAPKTLMISWVISLRGASFPFSHTRVYVNEMTSGWMVGAGGTNQMIRSLALSTSPLASREGKGAGDQVSHQWPMTYQFCLCKRISTQLIPEALWVKKKFFPWVSNFVQFNLLGYLKIGRNREGQQARREGSWNSEKSWWPALLWLFC